MRGGGREGGSHGQVLGAGGVQGGPGRGSRVAGQSMMTHQSSK